MKNTRGTSMVVGALLGLSCSLCAMSGCGGKDESAPAEAPKLDIGPEVGVLELPVSLRSGDSAPADARKVEATLGGLRVDGTPLLAFESGKVPAAEQSGDGIAKLDAALGSGAKKAVELTAHASLPYETAARVIASARKAGVGQL